MTQLEPDMIASWLSSGRTVRISGLDLRPLPHPAMKDTPWCIVKGQASVYFLEDANHHHRWLLKKFSLSRRPSDEYLRRASQCLPGRAELFTCTQRRFLKPQHLDRVFSGHRDARLASWLDGTLLMPKVPGQPWASIADQIRDGELELDTRQRLRIALSLAACIGHLEAGQCSHRDLSATNTFVTDDGRIYLIDLDSLYHPSLAFEPNTTIGTRGYIAPFTRTSPGEYDARLSWCPLADRFPMTILIAEILLVTSQTRVFHEDGSFFSQAQLEKQDKGLLQTYVNALGGLEREFSELLRQALEARSFEECPSPATWQAALQRACRRSEAGPSTPPARQVCCSCANCGARVLITGDRLASLRQKGRSILCGSCLQVQRHVWEIDQARRNWEAPSVVCEHCARQIRRPKDRVEQLRNNGKPILCGPCLQEQISRWQGEQATREQQMDSVTCPICLKDFRIDKAILSDLRQAGKTPLCRPCRESVRNRRQVQNNNHFPKTFPTHNG